MTINAAFQSSSIEFHKMSIRKKWTTIMPCCCWLR